MKLSRAKSTNIPFEKIKIGVFPDDGWNMFRHFYSKINKAFIKDLKNIDFFLQK